MRKKSVINTAEKERKKKSAATKKKENRVCFVFCDLYAEPAGRSSCCVSWRHIAKQSQEDGRQVSVRQMNQEAGTTHGKVSVAHGNRKMSVSPGGPGSSGSRRMSVNPGSKKTSLGICAQHCGYGGISR